MKESPLARALCPGCKAGLDLRATPLACDECGRSYPRVGDIPVLLPRAQDHIALWRGQLGLLLERGRETLSGLTDAAGTATLTGGKRRLLDLGAAVATQVEDLAAVLGPALGGAGPAAAKLPRGVVEYSAYLYRDWAWPSVGHDENAHARSALAQVIGETKLGQTLVVGAGACGLAYDLHRLHGASETVVLDIDPYLLVIAERVVRGRAVRLTEASLKVMDQALVSRSWVLQAPAGPLSTEAFHFFFADGVTPPFREQSFDTVVTPWFIDQVPSDLPAFLATLQRLLRPGGRWLNQGPLIYPEHTPFERRYSREELFELAARAGFVVGASSVSARPYLVSPLSGSGKVESVLTFVTTRP